MLFVKSSTNNKVKYREIIENLEKYMSESEVMQLVIDNLNNIIKDLKICYLKRNLSVIHNGNSEMLIGKLCYHSSSRGSV